MHNGTHSSRQVEYVSRADPSVEGPGGRVDMELDQRCEGRRFETQPWYLLSVSLRIGLRHSC